MTELPDTGKLTCPRCGEQIKGAFVDTEVDADDDTIRVPFECPECDAPLEIVVDTAAPEATGVDVWVEDRHEEDD